MRSRKLGISLHNDTADPEARRDQSDRSPCRLRASYGRNSLGTGSLRAKASFTAFRFSFTSDSRPTLIVPETGKLTRSYPRLGIAPSTFLALPMPMEIRVPYVRVRPLVCPMRCATVENRGRSKLRYLLFASLPNHQPELKRHLRAISLVRKK